MGSATKTLKNILKDLKRPLYFDGAFGTMLQKKNAIELGELPPILNITKPEVITEIHREYKQAGSDVATTNTFEANRLKLKDTGYTVEEVVSAAIDNAEKSGTDYTALDIGPTGELLEPMGSLPFEEAYDIFREIILGGKDRTDFIILETFSDLLEIKAALLAAKENSDLPVIASMTFTSDGRTFTGTDPVTAAVTLQELGADAIGVNCSLGPEELIPVVEKILSVAKVPVIVQANAGLPEIIDNKTVYTITPKDYADALVKLREKNVSIIGGCCGTTPEYISTVIEETKDIAAEKREKESRPALTSSTKTTFLDDGIKIIGERLNPTGKDKLKEALKAGVYDIFVKEGLSQEAEGADILDVNVGMPGIDEKKALTEVVKSLSAVTMLPLQIDTTKKEALESALRVYPGIPVINSVNGRKDSLETVLPLAKKYGAYVIGLPLDEDGIPKTVEDRLKIVEKILAAADKYGPGRNKIIIDALCLTASAEQKAVQVSLEMLRRLKEMKVLTTLGVSNVSFGLPERELFNSVYLAAALTSGLDLPIINPGSERMREVLDVYRVINNEDYESRSYVRRYAGRKQLEPKEPVKTGTETLKNLVISGLKEESVKSVKNLLEEKTPQEVLDTEIIPALADVGERFERGEIFLPQLMQSAAAVQDAFELIREKSSKETNLSKGRILLATVKGDIHDIGKNIVKMMLENYGYTVYDLGTDVDPETIFEKSQTLETPLIGLSALMTTTVDSMKETIELLREKGVDNKVIVGGAVLTDEYAKMIGADFYAPDAQAAVRIANKYFKVQEKTNE